MARRIPPWVKPALEFGPVLAFVVVYMIYRNETFVLGGTEYSGFVAVTALFLPIFLLSTGALWALTGKITWMQAGVAGLLVVFGGLGVWMNDPALIKMKPTVIYGGLALVLWGAARRGRYPLQAVMEEMIPMRKRGWVRLTKRVVLLFAVSALANEVVWRTQPEAFWVVFETVVMPGVILVFFLAQIPLFVENASMRAWKRVSGGRV